MFFVLGVVGVQSAPCSRSAEWASEIWEEISHFPSHISANIEQVQGSLSTKQQDKRIKFIQLNSEPAPGLNLRLRGPRVTVTVPRNERLTRVFRPAASDASRWEVRQGAPGNPCSVGISKPRCLPGCRTPYRYVNTAAYNMVARFPSDISVPSFQASWQDGTDQGACYWPYFYPWGGYSGYGYYPNFNFSNVTCYEAIPGSSRGSFSDPISVHSCNAEVSLSSTSSQVASCSNSSPSLPLSKSRTINRGSQYSASSAISTCSSIIFQKCTFLDSLTEEPVTGSTGFCRSTANWNTCVEGTTFTSSALPLDVRVSSRVDDPYGHVDSALLDSSRIPVADYFSVGPLGFVPNDVPTDSSFLQIDLRWLLLLWAGVVL